MPPAYPSVKTVFYSDRLLKAVEDKVVEPFLAIVGSEYAKGVQLRMKNSPATGRVYKRGSRVHRASAPGEAPKPDTGDLVKSIRFRRRDHGTIRMVEIGSTKKHALYLEYGAARLSAPPTRIRRRRKQTGREARWVLYPRPSWGPEMVSLRARMPALLRRASRMRK
jgi:hypothetical protein